MPEKKHLIAILQALLVTLLWSSSFIIIKYGLLTLPAVTFAGLRYSLAGILLIIYVFIMRKKILPNKFTKKQWIKLIALGIILYFITQGAQYLGLYYLPAVQVSLLLNFTPLFVMILATTFLNEKPTKNNIIGVIIFLIGVITFFIPLKLIDNQFIGYIIMVIGVVSNAVGTVLGRNINQSKDLSPIVVTSVSMTIGGIMLLLTGIATETFPTLSIELIGLIAFLAIVCTAFAFSLWNHTMRELSSVESSIINNTMLIQIAILSWLFLDNPLSIKEIIGIVIAAIGALLVQYKKRIINQEED